MPVAALILIRPRIEVKAIESNSLRTDRDRGKERTYVAIEAIFVHAEVGGGVAQAEEAREEWCEGGATARRRRVCGRRRGIYVHRRPWRTCGSGRSGTSCHSVVIMEERRKKGRVSIGGIFSETRGIWSSAGGGARREAASERLHASNRGEAGEFERVAIEGRRGGAA